MELNMTKLRQMNELDRLIMCPRCADAIPVFIRTVTSQDRFGTHTKKEIHCLKCQAYGHKDGTFIRQL